MQEAIDQIMRTYGMMFNLSPSEELPARERVTDFLKGKGNNTRKLTLEGVKFLRGDRVRAAACLILRSKSRYARDLWSEARTLFNRGLLRATARQ